MFLIMRVGIVWKTQFKQMPYYFIHTLYLKIPIEKLIQLSKHN